MVHRIQRSQQISTHHTSKTVQTKTTKFKDILVNVQEPKVRKHATER